MKKRAKKTDTAQQIREAQRALTELRRALRPLVREWRRLDNVDVDGFDDKAYAAHQRRMDRIGKVFDAVENVAGTMPYLSSPTV